MIGRRPRSLSQHSYQLLQDIRRENERLRQLDEGFGYRRAAPKPKAIVHERAAPVIDAVRTGDTWAA